MIRISHSSTKRSIDEAAQSTEYDFDIERIKKQLNITPNSINVCYDNQNELKSIFDQFLIEKSELIKAQTGFLTQIGSILDTAHSIRSRIKNGDHLIEKIIRKSANEANPRYTNLNQNNYAKVVMDLIGYRIIILSKKDWELVHNKILSIFDNSIENYLNEEMDPIKYYDEQTDKWKKLGRDPLYIVEDPIAHITANDDENMYKGKITIHRSTKEKVYSSIHYTVRYGKYYFEIQVRTLFEEGWLEFDHKIKYPYDNSNEDKKSFLNLLINLATTGDSLISFYDRLDFTQTFSNVHNGDRSQNSITTENPVSVKGKSEETLNDFLYKL